MEAYIQKAVNHFLDGEAILIEKHEGENNIIWIIDIDMNKYVLRENKVNVSKEQLLFEARFLEELNKMDLPLKVPQIMKTKDGKLFLDFEGRAFTLYKYIEGKKRYEWSSSNIPEEDVEKAYEILAKMHNAYSKISIDRNDEKPNVIDMLDAFYENLLRVKAPKGEYASFLEQNKAFIAETIRNVKTRLISLGYANLPEYPVQVDFHLGNIIWKGKEMVGLIDFDWSQYSTLEWDFCKSCKMICGNFKHSGESNEFDRRKLALALKTYNKYAERKLANIPLLQELLKFSSLFLINWSLEWFTKNKDKEEYYLSFLQAGVERLRNSKDDFFLAA